MRVRRWNVLYILGPGKVEKTLVGSYATNCTADKAARQHHKSLCQYYGQQFQDLKSLASSDHLYSPVFPDVRYLLDETTVDVEPLAVAPEPLV